MKPEARAALEMGPDGQLIGRDPRTLLQDELRAIGHTPMSPMEAIRARCVDCCSGVFSEVRKCTAVACPSWPFRMGKSPWKEKRVLSPEHLAKLKAARPVPHDTMATAEKAYGSLGGGMVDSRDAQKRAVVRKD